MPRDRLAPAMDVTDEAGVRRITLDDPNRRNAIGADDAAAMAAAVEAVEPASHDAVVITGEDPAFCAGGDIEAMAARDWADDEFEDRIEATFGRLARAMIAADVPTVARVNGDAVGAGLAIVALCDLAYASREARFSAAFARMGLLPDAGGTFILPALVGLRDAQELVLTARFVDGDEAATMGLITDAVPARQLDDRVETVLERLAGLPTATLGRARKALHEHRTMPWSEALAAEARRQAEAYATPEHAEGVAAFLEGREPDFPT